ncbi:hypothetical protein GCM10008939_09170 [Deinococcus aquiradiocola]|uniref:Thiol-activated cytolysin n=1 Tax=Deinococcus aquiradiocola TaxID=393059 RepID=A0A917P8Z2_9DEIO|nr:hypothetical protein GCM10008939_09170 [Deinococcus aquiradiocola]
MIDFRLRLALVSTALVALSACGTTPVPSAKDSANVRTQYVLPEEPCDPTSIDCGSGGGGGGEPTGPGPDDVYLPAATSLAPMSELRQRAQQLGVSPLTAGLPNINQVISASGPAQRGMQAQTVPTSANDTQDYVNQLFRMGQWTNGAPGQNSVPLPPDQGCDLERVDVTSNPEDLVSFDPSSMLYPGALVQGQYVNLGVGALNPINVPSTLRKPIALGTDLYLSATGQTATANPATMNEVNTQIGNMIRTAQSQNALPGAAVYFESFTASSLNEAAVKMGLDVHALGAGIQTRFSNVSSDARNTVFVRMNQSIFRVAQDLNGNTPVQGLFNSSFGVNDLNALAARGEIDSANLPTYVSDEVFGRMLVFSLSSNVSSQELDASVKAVYRENEEKKAGGSFTASAHDKQVVNEAVVRVFGWGGLADPTISVIRSGSWLSYFDGQNVPLSSLKPLSFTLRRWDNQLATMTRTTSYTKRTCSPRHKVEVEVSELGGDASVGLKTSGALNFDTVKNLSGTSASGRLNVSNLMSGGDDEIKVSASAYDPGFLKRYRWQVRVKVFVDNVERLNEYRSCTGCHSQDPVFIIGANSTTGTVNLNYGY